MNKGAIKISLVIIILMSLIIFIYLTDFEQVVDQLRTVGYGFIGIILLSSLSFITGSIGWKYCFVQSDKVSVFKLFYIRTIGEMISLINPTNIIAGEASKIFLLDQKNISLQEKSDSVFISRFILISSQLILSLVCLGWLAFRLSMINYFLIFLLVLITLILFSKNKFKSKESKQSKKQNSRFQKVIRFYKIQSIRFLVRFSRFRKENRSKLYLAYACYSLHWFVGAIELLLILYFLGYTPLLIDALSVDMGVVILKSIGGFVPAQIGIEELGHHWMLGLIGIKTGVVWISVSILRRARQLFWISASAMAYMAITFAKNNEIKSKMKLEHLRLKASILNLQTKK